MNNLILSLIAVIFSVVLVFAGVNYLERASVTRVTVSTDSIADIEQMVNDYQNLRINLGRRPAVNDYTAIYNGQSTNSTYSYSAGTPVRPSSLMGAASLDGNASAGWAYAPGCGTGAATDCFFLKVDPSTLPARQAALAYQAAQLAAQKEGNGTNSSIVGLVWNGTCSTSGGCTVAPTTDPSKWPASVSGAYYLTVQLSPASAGNAVTVTNGTVTSVTCTNGGGCTYGDQSEACGATWSELTQSTANCPFGYAGEEIITTTTPYICAGVNNPLQDGNSSQSTSMSGCLLLTAVPTWGACNTSCGTGTQPVASYYCVDPNNAQYPASMCAAPAPQSCSVYSGCTYSPQNVTYGACTAACGASTSPLNSSWTCLRSDGTTVAQSFCTPPASTQSCLSTSTCTYSPQNVAYGACAAACGASTEPLNSSWTCLRSDGTTVAQSNCTAPAATKSCTDTSTCTFTPANISYATCAKGCGAIAPVPAVSWTCTRSDGTTGFPMNDCTTTATEACSNDYSTCTYSPQNVAYGSCAPACGASTEPLNSGWTCLRSDGTTVAQSNCTPPASTQSCSSTSTCTYSAQSVSYGSCAAACGASTEPLNNTWTCLRSDGTLVAQSVCTANGDAPAATQSCDSCSSCATVANGSYSYNTSTNSCQLSCNGPYTLSTSGTSCVQIINGTCGSDYSPTLQDVNAPWTDPAQSGNLCATGTPGNYGFSNDNWTWTCYGANTGSPQNCSEQQYFVAHCSDGGLQNINNASPGVIYSSANGWSNWSSTPGCCYPNHASNVSWPLHTASVPGCNAPVNGSCGTDQGGTFSTYPWTTTPSGLCANDSTGATAYGGTLTGNTWGWYCAGQYGGAPSTQCQATRYSTESCSAGGLGGTGTIYYDGSGNWASAPGCCVNGVSDQSTTPMYGLQVIGCGTSGAWTVGGWGSCSASCGGGTQTRTVSCSYDTCTGTEPATSQPCNNNACGWDCIGADEGQFGARSPAPTWACTYGQNYTEHLNAFGTVKEWTCDACPSFGNCTQTCGNKDGVCDNKRIGGCSFGVAQNIGNTDTATSVGWVCADSDNSASCSYTCPANEVASGSTCVP